MDREICLDTDILIEITKNSEEIITFLRKLGANLYTTPINSFEIWTGRLRKEEEHIKNLIENLKSADFNKKAALRTGDIYKYLKEKGELIDFRDIFIASVCIENNLELFTNNKKHFERLKKFGLKLVE
jgi:predicted nucleic acid-binding protein